MTPFGSSPFLANELKTSSTLMNHHLAAMVSACDGFHFQGFYFRPVLCHVLVERTPRNVPLHTHHYCELTFVAGGSMIYRFRDGDAIEVTPGEFFLMPPGVEHQREHPGGKCELWGFLIEVGKRADNADDRLTAAAAAVNHHWCPGKTTATLLRLWLENAACQKGFMAEACATLSQALICAALREVFMALPAPLYKAGTAPVTKVMIVERARRYVHLNMAHAPRVAEVARHLGVSVRHLQRIFKEEEGVSLGEWSLNERLAQAQALLTGECEMQIGEIAAACGFNNVSNFCHRFRERCLYTPARYRIHCRQ